jgi:hypothetical protein
VAYGIKLAWDGQVFLSWSVACSLVLCTRLESCSSGVAGFSDTFGGGSFETSRCRARASAIRHAWRGSVWRVVVGRGIYDEGMTRVLSEDTAGFKYAALNRDRSLYGLSTNVIEWLQTGVEKPSPGPRSGGARKRPSLRTQRYRDQRVEWEMYGGNWLYFEFDDLSMPSRRRASERSRHRRCSAPSTPSRRVPAPVDELFLAWALPYTFRPAIFSSAKEEEGVVASPVPGARFVRRHLSLRRSAFRWGEGAEAMVVPRRSPRRPRLMTRTAAAGHNKTFAALNPVLLSSKDASRARARLMVVGRC